MSNSPFIMPAKPKNGLDLLKWLIFEPVLIDRFSKKLTKKEAISWFLKAYTWIVLFSLLLCLAGICTIAGFNLPTYFPNSIKSDFLKQWQRDPTLSSRIKLFMMYNHAKSLIGLAFGLAFGLGVGSAVGLDPGLGLGLGAGLVGSSAFSLGIGLAFGLGVGLAFGLGVGLAFGLGFGLGRGLGVGLAFGLGVGLGAGLVASLVGGLAFGLGVGLGFCLGWYITYFRLIFYPFHIVKSFLGSTLQRNPYLRDGAIWLPIPGLRTKLTNLAKYDLVIATDFANFLFEYRPLQRGLAMHLLHAVTAGAWQYRPLDGDILQIYPCEYTISDPPIKMFGPLSSQLEKATVKFIPSEAWADNLGQLHQQLVASQKQSNIGLRKVAFEKFIALLQSFRTQTLLESPRWNYYYLEPIDRWLEVAREELARLELQAQTMEPMASNIYIAGESLQPRSNDAIFVGRTDMKDRLTQEVWTAATMPLFLIQGQRRVGKTSLLNFLPDLLGPRFKVIHQDLQKKDVIQDIPSWLKDLRRLIDKELKLPITDWQPPADWLEAWREMREYLETLSNQKDYKLILAFDEYEHLHDIFQSNCEAAKNLLDALRSFSQHQNHVVFLFVGASFFSELKSPNWNEYFVQAKDLRVDYLKKSDCVQLITQPTPDFRLTYPNDLVERIFDLTQGHPTLVQQICSEMMNIANSEMKKDMTHGDLDNILKTRLIDRENNAINIFLTQFCKAAADRETVNQILGGQTPTDKVSLSRLERHGYIIKDNGNGNGSWKMRVPIFDLWLRKFAETFE